MALVYLDPFEQLQAELERMIVKALEQPARRG